MSKLGLQEVVLGGWSNGGFDVLSYVHQFGIASLKGLVLIDAAPAGTETELSDHRATGESMGRGGIACGSARGGVEDQ